MSTVAIDPSSNRLDRFGVAAGTLCAVHCAACALLPTALGTLGLGFMFGHRAEWVFTITAVAFALGALVFSRKREHSTAVMVMLTLGILGLLASRGLEMSSGHHNHPEQHMEKRATQGVAAVYSADSHHMAHEAEGETHHAQTTPTQQAGSVIGVLAGLLLLSGHLLNLKPNRQCPQECCK